MTAPTCVISVISGSDSAASTTFAIFSTVRQDTPANSPILSDVLPLSELAKVSLVSFGGHPVGVATAGAIALRIASISLGKKSLRSAFSAMRERSPADSQRMQSNYDSMNL